MVLPRDALLKDEERTPVAKGSITGTRPFEVGAASLVVRNADPLGR